MKVPSQRCTLAMRYCHRVFYPCAAMPRTHKHKGTRRSSDAGGKKEPQQRVQRPAPPRAKWRLARPFFWAWPALSSGPGQPFLLGLASPFFWAWPAPSSGPGQPFLLGLASPFFWAWPALSSGPGHSRCRPAIDGLSCRPLPTLRRAQSPLAHPAAAPA